MKNKSENNSTIANFIWRFTERTAAQLVTFVVSIILARILLPGNFGTIALFTCHGIYNYITGVCRQRAGHRADPEKGC